MRKLWMLLVAFLGLGGCDDQTSNLISIGQGVYGLTSGLFGWLAELIKPTIGLILIVTLLALPFISPGCTSMYPKFMDTPEFQKAAVDAFAESAKTMSGAANVTNPEVEFYYKIAVGGRVVGVSGNVQGSGTTTGRTTTQPAS